MDTLFTDATASTPGTPLVAAWHNDANSVVYNTLAAVAGANAITAVGPLSMSAYALGQRFFFVPASANSGAVTIDINGLGAKSILFAGVALEANMLAPGHIAEIYYDGTNFQLLNSQTFPLAYATGTLPFSQVTGIVPVVQGGSGVSVAANAPWNAGRLLNVRVFTSSATYTPTAGTNRVIAALIGGGGGGGGAGATVAGQISVGAGGGGGCFALVQSLSNIGSQLITIGAGGAGGIGGAAGGSGGTSSIGSLLVCPGGAPGQSTKSAVPPGFAMAGAGSSFPTFSAPFTLLYATGQSSGQAGHGPSLLSGSGGPGGTGFMGSAGGAPVYGGNGNPAYGNHGAGGGGAHNLQSSSSKTGGAGSLGLCVIYEYA